MLKINWIFRKTIIVLEKISEDNLVWKSAFRRRNEWIGNVRQKEKFLKLKKEQKGMTTRKTNASRIRSTNSKEHIHMYKWNENQTKEKCEKWLGSNKLIEIIANKKEISTSSLPLTVIDVKMLLKFIRHYGKQNKNGCRNAILFLVENFIPIS